jgi:hypothetical protein
MVRNLYRFYLYAVYDALLVFAMVAFGRLLQTLLELTPLKDTFQSAPGSAEVTQSVVFALVSWVIAGLLGGLHYWLIRRDIQNDSTAANSGIRSFFLNIPEGIGAAIAIPVMGLSVVSNIGQAPSGVVGSLSFTLPTFVFILLLELERRRTQVSSGVALVFQRLHFYGVQIVLLITLTFAWQMAVRSLVDSLLFGGRGTLEWCQSGGFGGNCPGPNLIGSTASALWFILFWLGYGWAVRDDKSTILRFILHFVSFAYGVGFIIYGIYNAFSSIILLLLHEGLSLKDIVGPSAQYDFFSPFTFGLLVAGIYYVWIRTAAQHGLIDQTVASLIENAIVALLAAVTFWWGIGYVLYNTFEKLAPSPTVPDAHSWASAIALVVAGIGYIPFDLYLSRRYAMVPSSAAGPRRGFVLTLLGAGILALAIGGATALYAWITSLSGSPLSNGTQVTHIGLAAFLVGVLVVGIYLWVAIREHHFSGLLKQPAPVVTPPPVVPGHPGKTVTIEEVLDELLAGKITRDEAAARIRAIDTPASSLPSPAGTMVPPSTGGF